MIETVKIFESGTDLSREIAGCLKGRLTSNNFKITDDNKADLMISVGGDGTFLKTLKETNFDIKPLYVGVLSGHLGFLQEINLDEIDAFIESIKTSNYKIEELSILNTYIEAGGSIHRLNSLNEAVIREKSLKILHLYVEIDGSLIEKFSGDGMVVSTPIGSTAYNLSVAGSIVYPSLHVIQIAPLAPLNSQSYRSLRNSIIVPPEMTVRLTPVEGYSRDLVVFADGRTEVITDAKKIEIRIDSEHIKALRFENYNFWKRIKEKFL